MFKPHSLFIKKKSNESDFDLDAANESWNKLSDSKLTKFVRKAEKAYDSHVASLDQDDLASVEPLHHSLTIRELGLLLKHYGLPDKLPANTRLYYFNKINQNAAAEAGTDEESEHSLQYKQVEEKWKSLSETEKAEYAREYREAELEYNRSFFQFAKTLPENRMADYEYYLDRPVAKKPRAPRKSIAREAAQAIREFAETNGKKDEKELKELSVELKLRDFVPWEIYYEKKKEDFAHLGSAFTAKAKAHSSFAQLSDKKKLKYIREAESRYDAYKFKSNPKPLLSNFLNKLELKILLKSYNMPEKVLNPSAQYMKEHIKEAGDASVVDRMKIVAAKYKNMDDKVKTAFLSKLSEESKRYEELLKQFLDKLPEARKADYEAHIKRKSSKRSASPSATASKKAKKSSSSKKSKSSSKEDKSNKMEPGQQQIVIVDAEPSGEKSSSAKRKAPAAAAATSASNSSSSVKQLKLKMFKS